MWVAVLYFSARKQSTHFGQFLNDRAIGIALFAIGLENCLAAKEWQISAETPIFHHVIGNHLLQHAQVAIELKLFHTVRGCTMHKSRAFTVGDKISRPEISDVIPFALTTVSTMQRMAQLDFRQILRRDITQAAIHRRLKPRTAQDIFGQCI